MKAWLAPALVLGCSVCPTLATAAAPRLYEQPFHQSVVRAEPDELLMLAGYGFSADDVVVYRVLTDTTNPLTPPEQIPKESTTAEGTAPVVSKSGVPYSLTVKLPAVMGSASSYAIWVRNKDNEWSNGVRINDARPLWASPATVYSTTRLAFLPRYLKIIGRNLAPAPDAATRVRLVGPETYTLEAANDRDSGTAIENYVARVDLPDAMRPGAYSVEVSRDRVSWVALAGQKVTVLPDPAAQREFAVDAAVHGGCNPDDGADDSACIKAAIAAAKAANGGVVTFGRGVWNLRRPGSATGDGIVVPIGVSLRGAGRELTSVVRDAEWASSPGTATFTLQGRNSVQGFTFTDEHRYKPKDVPSAMLRLGKAHHRLTKEDPRIVEDVVITGNVFDRPHRAIAGGLALRRLFVTYNEFGAFEVGFAPSGDRFVLGEPFRLEDSVVTHNVFKPGSYLDVPIGQGTIASTIGAATRLDFSENVADGTATRYLYSPDDARGWRAAFFWHMNNNHEMMLVSRNEATCTGDKAGDGEAFSYDNNANTFAFASARTVVRATSDTITVHGPLRARQNDRALDVSTYYAGHWVQIAEGRGRGQARRIESYVVDAASGAVTFKVSPAWDVVPQAGASRMIVGREFWQVYTVDNIVDHRTPPCLKSNRNGPEGGKIALWAQTTDSVVEGNRLYDSDGITLHQNYTAEDPACPKCVSGAFLQSFIEVRGNTIDGEYDWKSDCSQSGILVSHSAAPTPGSPPPVVGYGISIVSNTIIHADGFRGGAITIPLTWHPGPSPHKWQIVDNTLIQHNVIRDVKGSRASRSRCDGSGAERMGIQLSDRLVWNSVLYANRCENVSLPLDDRAIRTTRVCPSSVQNSCECAR